MAKHRDDQIKTAGSRQFQSDAKYQHLLNEIKLRLQNSQFRAAIIVNRELIQFYWGIGKLIIERQATAKWGEKLFEVLAEDLRLSFPNTEGFSKTNLKYMRLFARHYPNQEFGQALPDQLTWTHHVVLIHANDFLLQLDLVFTIGCRVNSKNPLISINGQLEF